MDRDFRNHAAEFKRYMQNHQWEPTADGGILFPRAGAIAHGWYEHDVNGQDVRIDKNLLTTEGINHLLDVVLRNQTQIAAWYLALYSGAVSPTSAWDHSNFVANATEITSGTEGYSESTRVLYVPAAAASGSINNTASKAAFTIVTASALLVNGCGLLSASAKGATTGKLFSAARFAAQRSLSNTDVFNLGYTATITSS